MTDLIWSDGWRDPTYGSVDRDLQEFAQQMEPGSLAQLVAIQHTLQDSREQGRTLAATPHAIHLTRDQGQGIICTTPERWRARKPSAAHADPARVTCRKCLAQLELEAIDSIMSVPTKANIR